MFCRKCGELVEDTAKFCPHCGATLTDEPIEAQVVSANPQGTKRIGGKSKIAAALLAFFLGYLGVHNFYLGHTGKAIAQLLLTVIGWLLLFIGPLISTIWSFVEFILILVGRVKDSDGCELQD